MRDSTDWTIFSLLKPYRKTVYLIVALQIIGAVAQVGTIVLLKPILLIGVYGDNSAILATMSLVLIACTLILAAVLLITTRLASKVATHAAGILRNSIMEAAVNSNDINALGTTPTDAMVCLTNDVSRVQKFIFETLRTYIPMPILLLFLLIYTFETNVTIGAILLLTIIVTGILAYLITKRIQPLFSKQVEYMADVNASLREKILGARTIRAYNGYEYEEKKFFGYSENYGVTNRKIALNNYFVSNMAVAIMWIFIVFIFVASALEEGNGLNPADIIIFMQFATPIIATLALIPYICIGIPRVSICYNHMKSVVQSAKSREKTYPDTVQSEESDYSISAKNVVLTDHQGRKILDDVNMEIGKGKTVTILGPNGSGSSNLVNMILGFSVPESGTLKVNGMDVSSSDPRAIRGSFSYASNSVHIFRGTLRYNLNPSGSRSDEEILEVCEKIGLGSYLSGLPEGLDTQLKDDVSSMSGGQRLLIIMVRSLLTDSSLFIFDDCLFSLDNKTKSSAVSTISEICKGKTVLYVMHDASTVAVSDSIILMHRGKVVGQGSHSDLLEDSTLYENLYKTGQGRNGSWA